MSNFYYDDVLGLCWLSILCEISFVIRSPWIYFWNKFLGKYSTCVLCTQVYYEGLFFFLQEGDVIVLLRQVDGSWFYGKNGEIEGIFPANFVKVMEPLSGQVCHFGHSNNKMKDDTGVKNISVKSRIHKLSKRYDAMIYFNAVSLKKDVEPKIQCCTSGWRHFESFIQPKHVSIRVLSLSCYVAHTFHEVTEHCYCIKHHFEIIHNYLCTRRSVN